MSAPKLFRIFVFFLLIVFGISFIGVLDDFTYGDDSQIKMTVVGDYEDLILERSWALEIRLWLDLAQQPVKVEAGWNGYEIEYILRAKDNYEIIFSEKKRALRQMRSYDESYSPDHPPWVGKATIRNPNPAKRVGDGFE